jgi:hypothetical protein
MGVGAGRPVPVRRRASVPLVVSLGGLHQHCSKGCASLRLRTDAAGAWSRDRFPVASISAGSVDELLYLFRVTIYGLICRRF